jgi:hypothetical protein
VCIEWVLRFPSPQRFGVLSLFVLQDFFLPSDSYDLLFLKARIVILCSKGFEIMDLSE